MDGLGPYPTFSQPPANFYLVGTTTDHNQGSPDTRFGQPVFNESDMISDNFESADDSALLNPGFTNMRPLSSALVPYNSGQQRGHNMDSSDESEQDPGQRRAVVPTKSKTKQKKIYSGDDARRVTEKVVVRAETMIKKASELDALGAKTHVKIQFQGSRKAYAFEHGQPFSFPRQRVSPERNNALLAVADGVATAVVQQLQQRYPMTPPMFTPDSQFAGHSSSPLHRSAGGARSIGACLKCQSTTTFRHLYDHQGGVSKTIETLFLACGATDADSCNRVVHLDCLGFPNVSEAAVAAMPNWYCGYHIANGREILLIEPKKGKGSFGARFGKTIAKVTGKATAEQPRDEQPSTSKGLFGKKTKASLRRKD